MHTAYVCIYRNNNHFFLLTKIMKAVERLYWDNFIQDFFTDQSTMKMGLFNMETSEQKSYGKVKNPRRGNS